MQPARDLAIAIPVRNAPEALAALLDQIAAMGLFSQVVIADDASDPPVDPAACGHGAARLGARLDVVRAEAQGGAGAARNRALDAVTARDVLFFDADDRLEGALPGIADLHAASGADITIFRHSDGRVGAGRGLAVDEALWDEALGRADAAALARPEVARLAKIVAYPWNKIHRTAFLREHGLRCSETPVHNDILLHWGALLRARRVIACRRIGAHHVVRAGGVHLTRRVGPERLTLFEPLEEVLEILRAAPDRAAFTPNFVQFAQSVISWNLAMLRGEMRRDFAARARVYLAALRPAEFAAYAARRPDGAMELVRFLDGAAAP